MSADTLPVKEMVRELSQQFSKAMQGYPAAVRGNDTYRLESDFAWYVHEITAGPSCMVYEYVNGCRDFIKNIKPFSQA